MGLWISYKDPRLEFHDLNIDTSKNQMTTEEKMKIWVPSLIFTNTAGRYHIRYNYERSIGSMTRKPRFANQVAQPISSPFSSYLNTEIFQGKDW